MCTSVAGLKNFYARFINIPREYNESFHFLRSRVLGFRQEIHVPISRDDPYSLASICMCKHTIYTKSCKKAYKILYAHVCVCICITKHKIGARRKSFVEKFMPRDWASSFEQTIKERFPDYPHRNHLSFPNKSSFVIFFAAPI